MHHALWGMLLLPLFGELLHEISMGLAMSQSKYDEYDVLREAFYHSLSLHILDIAGIQIDAHPIGSSALEQIFEWEGRKYPWNWFDLKRKFRPIPARFELAIGVQGNLCGLAVGKPSRGRRHLAVYFLEGNPDEQQPLKRQVLSILLEAASLYAVALGCEFVRLINPVLGLHSRYERQGYVFGKEVGGRVYCEKRVRVLGGEYASS